MRDSRERISILRGVGEAVMAGKVAVFMIDSAPYR